VPGDVVLSVEGEVEAPAGLAVIAFCPLCWAVSFLSGEDEDGCAVWFHRLQGIEGDGLVELAGAEAPEGKGFGRFVFRPGAERRVEDDQIVLPVGSVMGGIFLADGIALVLQSRGAFGVDFIGGDVVWIAS
jgi:hypothetical protein